MPGFEVLDSVAPSSPRAADRLIVRLYTALAAAWRDCGVTEAQAARFYVEGVPEDEWRSLVAALGKDRSRGPEELGWLSGWSRRLGRDAEVP